MPTVLTISRLRVVVYTNDHRPAHVHVIGGGEEAVFRLNCPDGPAELRENHGFTQKELSRIVGELERHLSYLCSKWKEIHEHF